MGFEGLLGNDQLKEELRQSLRRGRTAHFYLISGPAGSGRHTLARLLAAGLMCRSSEKPCGTCEACRKVLGGTHPDFITVDDPEKKTVTVDLIRQARADIYVQPNEGDKKIYLFPRAQDMGLPGQNALLKILEEPPVYGVFLLLTDNPESLLPTIRSRCRALMLQPLPEPVLRRELERRCPNQDSQAISAAMGRSGGYLGQALSLLEGGDGLLPQTEEFCAAFAGRDVLGLLQTLIPMEKWKRDQLIPALRQWLELLEESLVCRAGGQVLTPHARKLAASRSSEELLQALRQLQKSIDHAQRNISCAAICGWLQWALR
ncbi:MAG: DNA polymerase III subunit [Oscillospiraceae bacterium]|nr:DNA polymerase III subunit [Oscillospiraceae bacterium]